MDVKKRKSVNTTADLVLYEVIRTIRPLFRVLTRAVEDRLQGTGITVGLRAVLECLDDVGPQTVPQIGRSLGIGRQFIQRTVNASLDLEHVRVVTNPNHRRSSLVELTPQGEAVFRQIRAREQAVLRRIARRVTRQDIAACLRVLEVLTHEFQEITRGERR